MSGSATPPESAEADITLEGLSLDEFTIAIDQKRSRTEQAIIEGGDQDELERFRQEWRAEVKGRQGMDVGPPKRRAEAKDSEDSDTQQRVTLGASPVLEFRPATSPKARMTSPIASTAGLPDSQQDLSPVKAARSPEAGPSRVKARSKQTAVELYAEAVEHEQAGQLNDALMLYRRAFKIDDNVDRVYQRSLPKYAAEEEDTDTPTSTDIVSAAVPVEEPYSFQRHLQFQPDYQKTVRRRSPLSVLLDKASVTPDEAAFTPLDEDKPLPLATLPAELFEPIFNNLDVRALERFGSICWRARYLTSRADIWKKRVQTIYRWPMVTAESVTSQDLVQRHDGEWRTTFIEEDRVRLDGCYISVCHYVRPGSGDEWVAVTHMITYHRFLRFYQDGSVISFLTTDHPSTVVPLLRPSLRSKGLHFGRWRIEKGKVFITDLLEPGTKTPKYEFEMELNLKETQRGRWNKLDIHRYSSINLADGEVLGLSLKHQKPFYFSKVKSYHPAL